MKRLAAVLLLTTAIATTGCAGAFDKCVKPVASQITWTGSVTELGEVVAAFLLCDPTFQAGAVPACALQEIDDLASSLGPDGVSVVDCIIAYYESNGSAALQARAKAVGVKRGIKTSNLECRGLRL